jgi:DEAD/DEAH box helicase domain-containing protein
MLALMPWNRGKQPGDWKLRSHHSDAMTAYFGQNQSARFPVVTSGTGSGKTEAFLLPLLTGLVREQQTWAPSSGDPELWWNESKPAWSDIREAESRTAALRSLVLYPTNALVEDQLTRL